MCPGKMKDRLINLYDVRGKKQLQIGTCIIWFCGTVAFEGQIAMKALAPAATIPCRGTKDESSSIKPPMDLAQTLFLSRLKPKAVGFLLIFLC